MNIIHLHDRITNEDFYYGGIKAMYEDGKELIIGRKSGTLYRHEWHKAYTNERVIIKKAKLIQLGEAKRNGAGLREDTTPIHPSLIKLIFQLQKIGGFGASDEPAIEAKKRKMGNIIRKDRLIEKSSDKGRAMLMLKENGLPIEYWK